MKNLVLVVFLLCLIGAFASAQSPLRMQAGVTLGYDHYNLTDSIGVASATDDRNNLVIGGFLDAIYVRFIAEYQRAGSGTVAVTGYGSIDYPSGFSVTFLNLEALGKYPLRIGTATIWPAVGVRYSHPLTMTIGGVDALQDPTTDVADFYICLGGGIDFSVGTAVIGLSALYDYSLTPSQTTATPSPGENITAYDFEITLNVGFSF